MRPAEHLLDLARIDDLRTLAAATRARLNLLRKQGRPYPQQIEQEKQTLILCEKELRRLGAL